jgi:short-subunit dehydrogenase
MADTKRQLAVVTGASTGIGFELAKCCAENGFDLVVAADEPKIEEAAAELRKLGATVTAVQADLARIEEVERLLAAVAAQNRPVDALLANAGRGLGRAFLDQDWNEVRRVIDTNITGTLYLVQKIGRGMRDRRAGRILITGSIAGFMPGTYQAVYNGTKAFLDSFAFALRHELQGSGVTVTCLMPGATETDFFERADMMDTKIGTQAKDDPAMVARRGFEAMMEGRGDVVTGWQNKLRSAIASVLPSDVTAEMHRSMAAPGTAMREAVPRRVNGGAGVIAGLAIGAVALSAAASWYRQKQVEPALEEQTRRRLAPRTPAAGGAGPQGEGGALATPSS